MDPQLWTDLLVPGVSILEKVLRPILVYIFLIVGLRLAGKRELAQLNPFDLIVLLTLSNTVQNAIIGPDNSVVGGMIGAATLLAVNSVVVRFFYRHPALDRWVEGSPDVLIEGGEVLQDRLGKELITETELESAARQQGFKSLADVERAVLEPDGRFSFIGKKPTLETERHEELLARLDAMAEEIRALRAGKG